MNRYSLKPIVVACTIALASSTGIATAGKANKENSDLMASASLTTTYTLNSHLNPFDIDVEVHNGEAIISGKVESEIEKDLAEELAMGVEGIRSVKNELQVVPEYESRRDGKEGKGNERSFTRKVEDANLTAKVKSQLLWNSNTSGLSIDVDTENGAVTLTGIVESAAEAELAEQIARNTSDVRSVKNQLKVDKEAITLEEKAKHKADKTAQTFSDGWITTKVKSALLYNRHVDGSDINVDTNDGVVRLEGVVGSDFEREQAVSIARRVSGVKSVQSALNEY